MNRLCRPLALLVFFAGCGAAPEDSTDEVVTQVNTPTGWLTVPASVLSPPASGDLDATSTAEAAVRAAWDAQGAGSGAADSDLLATTVPFLFGTPAESFQWSRDNPGGGANPWWGGCYFPNSADQPCFVPVDKKVVYHWVGATTTSSFPGIDFKALLSEALQGLAAQNGGFGWTFQFSSSQATNEYGTFTTDNVTYPGLGNTATSFKLPVTSGVSCSAGPGGQYCFKHVINSCPTFYNINVMVKSWGGLSLSTQKARIVRMMKHEIGHCIGFDHLNGTEYLMNPYDNPTPTSFPSAERTAAQNFVP